MPRVIFMLSVIWCATASQTAGQESTGLEPIQAQTVMTGLTKPVFITSPPNDARRLFVVEQRGRIQIIENGDILRSPFLDIDALVIGGIGHADERGLLCLTFDPEFAANGYFYVNYTGNSGQTVISRFSVSSDPNLADPDSEYILLTISQPYPNHNGGWIGFGPDGYLYAAVGDGGDADDPGNRAQDVTDQLLGKILRLDVRRDDFPSDMRNNYGIPPDNPFVDFSGDDEIWAIGLRNPWRCAFDRLTGDLYIADVGQESWEEIDIQPASATGGENYGWRCQEADACTMLPACACSSIGTTPPAAVYSHDAGCAVIGGYVYRGCAIPALQGSYFFADYCSNRIWSFRYDGAGVSPIVDRTLQLTPPGGALDTISSFGEDADGELYFCTRQSGRLFKIVSADEPVDCNQNDKSDSCDIDQGASADQNRNRVPDECERFPSIIASFPAPGTIDARQPSNADGSDPSGWQSIDLWFDAPIEEPSPDQFLILQEGASRSPAPRVVKVVSNGADRATVFLSARINPCAWTTLIHQPGDSRVRIGYLPADVNGDGRNTVLDILSLIDALNGIATRPIWSTDINRSGATEAGDVLRLIDILNGVGAYGEESRRCADLP